MFPRRTLFLCQTTVRKTVGVNQEVIHCLRVVWEVQSGPVTRSDSLVQVSSRQLPSFVVQVEEGLQRRGGRVEIADHVEKMSFQETPLRGKTPDRFQ